jgi:pimeloyl-ACP methyl ester carboxylesterase
MYTSDVAERRGATVHRHYWNGEPPSSVDDDIADWVERQIVPVLDRVGGAPLLIGKSLGTCAAPIAAERSLPAIWLTPLLYDPIMVAALEKATAPALLVGGTADQSWDGDLARRLSPHVFEVDGANHGLYVSGPLVESVAVLGRVVVAVEAFLDRISWPS